MGTSTSVSSGALAAGSTTTLAGGHSTLTSIQLTTDGTNTGTLTVYDNTAGSGKVIAVLTVLGASLNSGRNFHPALRTDLGLTATVTGTGAVGYVAFGGA